MDGAVFCNACGVKQAVQAPQPTQQPPQSQQYQQPYQPQQYQQPYQPRSSMGNVATTAVKKGVGAGSKWIIALLISALVIGSVVIVFFYTDLGNIFKSDEQLIRYASCSAQAADPGGGCAFDLCFRGFPAEQAPLWEILDPNMIF